jgi:phage regulator Rha-like protein
MKELHESVAHTAKEITIKENPGFRIRLEKHEVINPKGLFSLDIIQESLEDGKVQDSQTYNFFMTKDELQTLANGLTA